MARSIYGARRCRWPIVIAGITGVTGRFPGALQAMCRGLTFTDDLSLPDCPSDCVAFFGGLVTTGKPTVGEGKHIPHKVERLRLKKDRFSKAGRPDCRDVVEEAERRAVDVGVEDEEEDNVAEFVRC